MKRTFFSIVIPTYNRATLLPQALASVLEQTCPDWELLVVDDGSTDGTRELMATYTDARIRYIYQDNAERSAARNRGIASASGQYVTFLDSDDYFMPERLERLKLYIESEGSPEAIFFTGLSVERDGLRSVRSERERRPDESPQDYIMRTVIHSQQVCAKREIFDSFRYDTGFRIGEDTELWIRISKRHELRYIPEQATVVVIDHDDRTVNEKKRDTPKEYRRTLAHIFSPAHVGARVSPSLQAELLSNAYYGSARHHIYNGRRWAALRALCRSLWRCPSHPQSKHRLFMCKELLTKANVAELAKHFS